MGEIVLALILSVVFIWFIKIMYFEKTTFEVKSILFKAKTTDGKCTMVYSLPKYNFDKKHFPSKKEIAIIKDNMIESIRKEHQDYTLDDFHFEYLIDMEGL